MKNYKSFFAGMLTMLLIVCLTGTALATTGKVTKELEYRNISVSLDGKKLDLRDAKGNAVEPCMFEGTNYLPVRALAESLGLNVAWDGATNTVVLTSDTTAEPPASGEQIHDLLFSINGIRGYYENVVKTDSGYEVNFSIDNGSDFYIGMRHRDLSTAGKRAMVNIAGKFEMSSPKLEPGQTCSAKLIITDADLAAKNIETPTRINLRFEIYEIGNYQNNTETNSFDIKFS